MNIVFLDVDGVLNNMCTKEKIGKIVGIEDNKVKILREIVDYLNADIVLTSTWKREWTKGTKYGEYLIQKLKNEGLEIKDRTYETYFFKRGEGIKDYLVANEVDLFVILDDEKFDYKEQGLSPYWIQTEYWSPMGGLQREHIEQVKEYFTPSIVGKNNVVV